MEREERFLVTGALGCLGSWTVASLVREGIFTTAFDLSKDTYRLEYLLNKEELSHVSFAHGDIPDLADLDRVVTENGVTHLIHLAALQVPFCRADPVAGALVNVQGTLNVFEVARVRRDIVKRVVFASSAAVYGPQSDYARGRPVPSSAILRPNTHYGVYKQANEGTARMYWQNEGISSIGLRPYIVYGVGRDQGLTSETSKAMLAAAVDQKFHISHGGRADFQLAEDVARTFISCGRIEYEGTSVHNLGGNGAHVRDVIAAIESASPKSGGRITFDEETLLPFPDALDEASLVKILDDVPGTPLQIGVQSTVQHFSRLASTGQIDAKTFLS